jgi:hypothetical protein
VLGIKLQIDPDEDIPPEFPEPLAYIWASFCEIIQGIQGNGWSHPVITWECLAAWSRLTENVLEPREAIAIIKLGSLRAGILNEALNKKNGGKG